MLDYDVVVVGAGQAGLAMGYYLKQEGLSYVLLDSNERIGDCWRKRYESLVLFTPRDYSSLPGLKMSGLSKEFPTKDEMANYLEEYAAHFDLPVKLNSSVISVKKKQGNFELETKQGKICTKQVVIASGAFQKPFIPHIVSNPDNGLFQIHSSAYKSPKQIPEGSVLIVGGGNSGSQIAVELSQNRQVAIAVSHPFKFLPLRLLGKSIFKWLEIFGFLYAGIDTKKGKWFRKQSDPIFGEELKLLIKEGKIKVMPKVMRIDSNSVTFENKYIQTFQNIVWATGFVPSYEWIQCDDAFLANGEPIHTRGVSPIKGLYFIGLPWQFQRGSALVCGVGRDAQYLLPYIVNNK